MNASAKFSNISISEKAKNRGLKHITFLFSEVWLSYIHWNALQAFLNGYTGINRSHKT